MHQEASEIAVILLMPEIWLTTWDGAKTLVNNGISTTNLTLNGDFKTPDFEGTINSISSNRGHGSDQQYRGLKWRPMADFHHNWVGRIGGQKMG